MFLYFNCVQGQVSFDNDSSLQTDPRACSQFLYDTLAEQFEVCEDRYLAVFCIEVSLHFTFFTAICCID